MSKQIKYGMVGGDLHAFIGEVHKKAIQLDTRAQLVAGCFSNILDYNVETAKAYDVASERVYADYKEMAEKESQREDKIDFVSIVTPNFLHYEIAKTFLLKGINVVCEKPLCFEVEEAKELEQLAKDKNLLFGVTYAYTGYTMLKVMKEMIGTGKIGNIVSINAEYVQDWLLDELSPESKGDLNLSVWRKDPKVSGISNCVGDIGTHIENMVHYLTGLKIKRVCATMNKFDHALDLNANILLEYENGINGAYWCSQVAAGRMNDLIVRIYGDQGSLEWEQHFPDYVKYTPKGEAPRTLSRGSSYISEAAGTYSRIPCGHPEGLYIGFANVYKNYITTLLKRKNGEEVTTEDMDFPTVTDGVNGVKFVHAVIESGMNDSSWVSIN